jgi:amidase
MVTQQSGPLSGKVLAVKDLFHIAGWPTSAGNPDWLNSHPVPQQTHSSITSLLRLGVQIAGKTHTDELAYSLNGQNTHYGTLINPRAPQHLPGGSSSGSAVAVADGSADIGLGTDTGGSIRVPAAYNGLFGLRPTHGSLPMDNMVPLAPSFDTVGWLTSDLNLCAQVASLLLPEVDTRQDDRPLVILEDTAGFSVLTNDILNWFNDRDICVNKRHLDLDLPAAGRSFRILQGFEIWQTHGEWITAEQPRFAADIQERLRWCASLTPAEKQDAQKVRHILSDRLTAVLEEYTLVLPTTPGAAPRLNSTGDFLATYRNQMMCLTSLAGLTGSPQLHLPSLSDESAPAGFSLLGARHSEPLLFNQAKRLLEKHP